VWVGLGGGVRVGVGVGVRVGVDVGVGVGDSTGSVVRAVDGLTLSPFAPLGINSVEGGTICVPDTAGDEEKAASILSGDDPP